MLKKILKVLPHVSIVMSGMLIVFFCIDRVNKPMGFMTNEFHKILTFLLALISLGYSVFIIAYQRKRERFEEARRKKAQAARRSQAAQARAPQKRPVAPQQRPVQQARVRQQ